MPDKRTLKNFFRVLDEADIGQKFEDDSMWGGLLVQSERLVKDIGEAVENSFHSKRKVANPLNVLPPDNLQTAYIAPKEETPLYNVMTDGRKPVFKKSNNLFKNLSFGIEDWDLKLTAKSNDKKYSILLGEHIGMELKFDDKGWAKKRLNVDYNTQNEKWRARYSVKTPMHDFSTTVFTQRGNIGASVSFTQKPKHVGTSFSIDKENMAASLNWYKDVSKRCVGKLSLYGNYNFKQKCDNVIGVSYTVMCK